MFFQSILSKQQTEIENILNRLTSQYFHTKKDQLVFQINNYDIILSVLDVKFFEIILVLLKKLFQEKVAQNSKERLNFLELQQAKIKLFVDEILSPYFLSVIHFVQECESLIEQNHTQLLTRFSSNFFFFIFKKSCLTQVK